MRATIIAGSMLLLGCYSTPAMEAYYANDLDGVQDRACGNDSTLAGKARGFCSGKVEAYALHNCGGDLGSQCSVDFYHSCTMNACKRVMAGSKAPWSGETTQQQSSQQTSGEPMIDEEDVFDAIMDMSIAVDGYDPEVHGVVQEVFDIFSE